MKFYFSYFTVIDLRKKKGRELLISNDRKKKIFINIAFNHKIIIIDFNAIQWKKFHLDLTWENRSNLKKILDFKFIF